MIIGTSCTSHESQTPLRFFLTAAPTSADPLEFDLAIHHITQRPTLSTLTDIYSGSTPKPLVAGRWHHTSDHKRWTFTLRRDLKFSNGSPIDSKTVAQSFARMSFLLQQRKSREGLLEFIIGANQVATASELPKGIRYQGDALELEFSDPVPRCLELIGFGQYAITHPNDYDPKTGAWLSGLDAVSSGAYIIDRSAREQASYHLRKRTDYPADLSLATSAKSVIFEWDRSQRETSTIAVGMSDDDAIADHRFFGPVHSNILFVRIQGAGNPKTPLSNSSTRILLRRQFYLEASKLGFDFTRSFFPTAISGVSQPEAGIQRPEPTQAKNPRPLNGHVIKYRQNPYFSKTARTYEKAIHAAILALGGTPSPVTPSAAALRHAMLEQDDTTACDIFIMGTGILIDRPDDDIRFMYLSKEGIHLPDADGKIRKLVRREGIDPQEINQAMWDQGLIWPVSHFAFGLLVSDQVDMSKINLAMPATDLTWIGFQPR